MERMVLAVDRKSNLRSLVISIVLSVGVMLAMFYGTQVLVYDIYGEFVMPDIRLSYNIVDFQMIFSSVGSEGMIVWAQVHLLDYIFPLTYSIAMAFGISLELKSAYPERNSLKKLIVLPFLGCAMDYLENLLILSQILSYPSLSEPIIILASTFTTVKWVSLAFSFFVIMGFLLIILYKKITSR